MIIFVCEYSPCQDYFDRGKGTIRKNGFIWDIIYMERGGSRQVIKVLKHFLTVYFWILFWKNSVFNNKKYLISV